MKHPITTLRGLNLWLSNHGNGIGVSWTNDCFTVFCQTGNLIGGARTLLGSGRTIQAAIEHAEMRIEELKTRYKTTPLKMARKLERSQWEPDDDGGVEQARPNGIPK